MTRTLTSAQNFFRALHQLQLKIMKGPRLVNKEKLSQMNESFYEFVLLLNKKLGIMEVLPPWK